MAFGYLSSRTSSSFLKTKLNVPLVLTLSILPDADLLAREIFPSIQHRGPTHSIISALIVFTPFFIIYRKRAVPYFIALVQHGLVGDYIAGGRVQLLWPITNMSFGTSLSIQSITNQTLEWTMFLAALLLMFKMKDYTAFFKPHLSNLILIIPTFTVILPAFLATPIEVPPMLIPPHVFCLLTFIVAIIIELRSAFPRTGVVPTPKVPGKPIIHRQAVFLKVDNGRDSNWARFRVCDRQKKMADEASWVLKLPVQLIITLLPASA